MTVCLLVITDGRRDCLQRTVASAVESLRGDIVEQVMYDDSGDRRHRRWLRQAFPNFEHINAGERQGFGGAIDHAWRWIAEHVDASHVWHLEDDFTMNRPVDLDRLAAVLDANPYLAQLALRRQPWNDAERAAGGIVEQHPDSYLEVTDGDAVWLEHRRFFTTNPSLYRRALLDVGWPTGPQSEGRFGIGLFEHGFDGIPGPDVRAGYWGQRESPPWVHHIGDERAGTGY